MARDCVLQDRNPDPVSASVVASRPEKIYPAGKKQVFFRSMIVPPALDGRKNCGAALAPYTALERDSCQRLTLPDV